MVYGDATDYQTYEPTDNLWQWYINNVLKFQVSATAISAQTLPIQNVVDPTNAQDAATKHSVETYCPAASDAAAGKVELATAAETTTGTDATRAVTPDGLAGSDYGKRMMYVVAFEADTAVATGDGKAYFFIPAEITGWNLVAVAACAFTVSSSGVVGPIQLYNLMDSVDMLSTGITIDAGEFTSYTADTPAVIDTTHDDVATGDRIRVDVDTSAGTGTKGLHLILTFQLP